MKLDKGNNYIIDVKWRYHEASNEHRAGYKGYTLRARDNKVSVLRLGIVNVSLREVVYMIDNGYTLEGR